MKVPKTRLIRGLLAGLCLAAVPAQMAWAGNWTPENSGAAWTFRSASPNDLRFEVHHGDVAPWDRTHSHKAERTEISEPGNKAPVDRDIWLAMGLMVEPGEKISSQWVVLGQLKPSGDPGDAAASPAWAQELNAADQFRIVIRTSPQHPLRSNPAAQVLFVDPDFERGRLYHFVYHLRYSQTSGLLQAWRDGKRIVDYSGPLGYVNDQGPYFKFGIYREPALETLAVHFLDLRFGGPELKPG